MGDEIDELIDAVTVDAYGDDDQLWAFRQAFEDEGRFPFDARVVGADVQVESIDYAGEERRGLIAHCRRERQLHTVSLTDVTPIPPVHGRTRRLLDAYRRWSGVDPLPPLLLASVSTWHYPGLARAGIDVPSPRLALFPRGDWDPRHEYWGEPDEPLPALLIDVIDAGMRPRFEMEQVLPGADEDDWDSDPIVEAVDLHHAGLHRDAVRVTSPTFREGHASVSVAAPSASSAGRSPSTGATVRLASTGGKTRSLTPTMSPGSALSRSMSSSSTMLPPALLFRPRGSCQPRIRSGPTTSALWWLRQRWRPPLV